LSYPLELLARASAWLWPALANHLWQATLFAALVACAALLLRRAPARVRFALWLVAAAKFAVPSALLAPLAVRLGVGESLFAGAAEPVAPLVLKFTVPVGANPSDIVAAVPPSAGHSELLCALTLVWLAGCALLAFVWLRRRREFVRSVRAGAEVWSGREFDAMRRARARLGLKDDALLVLSDAGTEPGVWRTREPVVVLPRSVAAELDGEELEAVLLHELAHVERRDNLFGNFQTALACAFWFNPAVWLVGRRLLAERERACDERVLEAGGRAAAYAAGILKVVRFCSGWRVAGVSGAASGSDLRRRIEMIMREEFVRGSRFWHRAVTCGLAAAALALTAGAGLLGRAPAAEARMLEGVGGETQDTPRVIVRAGRAEQRRGQEGPAVREVEQAAEASVYFEQAAGAPATITDARMRMITREQLRRADEEGADSFDEEEDSPYFMTLPVLTLANTSDKTIREVGVGFVTGGRLNVVAGYAASVKPGESQTFRSDWRRRNVIMPGTAGDVSLRLVWVTFDDGTQWGARARDPHPPMPPPPPPRAGASGGTSSTGAGRAPEGARASGGSGEGVGEGAGEGFGRDTASGGGTGKGGGLRGQKLYAPEPSYPPIAKAAGAEGEVHVKVLVDEDGNVVAAEAVSGHPLLQSAAVDAARAAKFKPTLVDGKPVKVSGILSYVFKLKDSTQ
jgi:TonB family protein